MACFTKKPAGGDHLPLLLRVFPSAVGDRAGTLSNPYYLEECSKVLLTQTSTVTQQLAAIIRHFPTPLRHASL